MIELLLEAIEPDGSLTVTRTDECYIHAEYVNRLAAGLDMQSYEVDGAIVGIVKGGGDDPEMLTVFAFGSETSIWVEDDTTGVVCVPYWEGV